MTMLRRIGMFASVAAATALLSGPVAFAEDGHAGHHRGADDRGGVQVNDDRGEVQVNDDRQANDVDDAVVAAGQVQQVVEVEPELNDLVDDND